MKRLAAFLAALALTGCVGHMMALEKPPADWPKLTISEHYGFWTTMANCNGAMNILLLLPAVGCAKVNLNNLTCDAYYAFKWVRQGEIEHCDGQDHPGADTFSAGWADYKDHVLGHAVGAGWIATW